MSIDFGALTSMAKFKPQTWFAVAFAGAAVLANNHYRWLPEIKPLEPTYANIIVGVVGFGLCVSMVGSFMALAKFFAIRKRIVFWFRRRRDVQDLRDYLPHMAPDEKVYIGYLLAANTKSLTCPMDGGKLKTLLSRGIIVLVLGGTPAHNMLSAPAVIPDHLWKVLRENEHLFPKPQGTRGGAPWFDRY